MVLKCLFTFEDSAKVLCLEETQSSTGEILQLFRTNFHYYGQVKIQIFSTIFQQYVDVCDKKDFTVTENNSKLKFVKSRTNQGDLNDGNCAVFCCDIQERFRSAISCFEQIVEISGRILKASQILSLPLIVTEQYPKGLLGTVEELDIQHAQLRIPKTKFSMLEPQVVEFLMNNPHITNIVLFGVEAHVCIQQTALDLLERGLQVFIAVDATSSRFISDRQFAFKRLGAAGAVMTTSESILFQLIRDKNHPQFKQIQQLIKSEPAKQPGLLLTSSM